MKDDEAIDPLDLSGAAEAAAVSVRRRLVSLTERLADEHDPAAIRDIAIGLAALGSAVESLDELAQREAIHKRQLHDWRENMKALLVDLTGMMWSDLRYIGDNLDTPLVAKIPLGDDERPDRHPTMRPLNTRPIHALREAVLDLDDRLYGFEDK